MPLVGKRLIIDKPKITIVHLSDLHFSGEADDQTVNSIHDHQMAAELCSALKNVPSDLVLISGDLSDTGNRDQLLRVKEYIFGSYGVSGTKKIGLELRPDQVRLLPGNHDAFNSADGSGSFIDRVQKSLENFYSIFTDVACSVNSCGYEWIEARGWNAYCAYADSCFVGDPDWEHTHPDGAPFLDTTARGKIAKAQSRRLLRWSDDARQGKLEAGPDNARITISASDFMASLKVLVMHHHMFEPLVCRGKVTNRLKDLIDKNHVFHNVAMADFDMLWCGHKHVPDFSVHTYGFHLKGEGRIRYALNCLRRTAGFATLPFERLPESGKMVSKCTRLLLGMASRLCTNPTKRVSSEELAEKVFSIITLATENPREFERKLCELIKESRSAAMILYDEEWREMAKKFEEEFDKESREKISTNVRKVAAKLATNFARRPFIQVLCPSATKRTRRDNASRGFCVHEIEVRDSSYILTIKPFEWRSIRENNFEFRQTGAHVFEIPLSRGFD